MRRRELMLLRGGAARALRAQQKAMPVGRPSPRCLARPVSPYMDAFRRGLSETGYVEGRNLVIEYRWAEGHSDRLPALADDEGAGPSETGQAPVRRGGFIRPFPSSRRRNWFAARKFDEPPLTAE